MTDKPPQTPPLAFGPYLNGFFDVARQWPDSLRRRVDEATARAAERRRAVRDAAQATVYGEGVRARFWEGMGGLPGDPLTPRDGAFRTSGAVVHLGVRIERIVYESLPGVPVTALLYRPLDAASRGLGAVLFLSGHYDSAKQHPEYQGVCLDLARHGLVVLAADPWGQGERWQYPGPGADSAPVVPPSVFEHSYCGLPAFLVGGALARYFAWDAVRAVDVLVALPEVDPRRIGVTGNSGGGTQSVLAMAADPRLAAAMPCTFVHGMSGFLRSGLPHDAEQNFLGSLARDVDHPDLLAHFAPRPLLVGAVAYDFFPIEVTESTVEEARQVYRAAGAGDALALVVDDDRHWYTDVLREQAVRFFTRTLGAGERYLPGQVPTLPEADLWCTPSGQVYRDRPSSRRVFELNREYLAARRRPAPQTAEEARERLEAALRFSADPRSLPIRPRYFAPREEEGYTRQQVFFFAEPEVAVAATILRPARPHPQARTWLVLLPDGTDTPEVGLTVPRRLLAEGHTVCVFDPRGRGAVSSLSTQARGPRDGWLGFEAYTAYVLMLLDDSSVAGRVFDVLRAVELLHRHEPSPGGLALYGEGQAALWGYLGAALDERVREAHLVQMLPSWEAIVETPLYDVRRITAACAIPGVLQHFDLPHLRALYAGRELRLERPLEVAAPPEALPF